MNPAVNVESQVAVFEAPFEVFMPSGRGSRYSLHFNLSKRGVEMSEPLCREVIKALGMEAMPKFWVVGIDKARCLIQAKPGVLGDRGLLRLSHFPKKGATFGSHKLGGWMVSNGVPVGRIFARWHPETGSIMASYGPAPAMLPPPKQPVEEKKMQKPQQEKPAGPVIETCGHRWRLSDYTGPTGGRIYRCEVCGYYTADSKNTVLKERKCKPGLYDGTFELRVFPHGYDKATATSKKEGR